MEYALTFGFVILGLLFYAFFLKEFFNDWDAYCALHRTKTFSDFLVWREMYKMVKKD